jgi:hypothetical protein
MGSTRCLSVHPTYFFIFYVVCVASKASRIPVLHRTSVEVYLTVLSEYQIVWHLIQRCLNE